MTEAEKIAAYGSIEEWGKQTIQSLIGIGSQVHYLSYDDTYRKQINYNLVSGYVNADDFNYVIKPYGLTKFNFPATFVNYNIITPKISLLEGEESRRPFTYKVIATGVEDTNEALRSKTTAMKQYFKQMWMQELQGMGVNVNDQDQVAQSTPQEIQKYFNQTYKTTKEFGAQSALEYLYRYCELEDKFMTAWRDLLITGEEIYWVGIRMGEPVVEVINPVYFHYDRNPNLKYIEDAAWAFTEYFMPPADVYDRYFDVLTEDQVEKIEQIKGGRGGNTIHNTAIGIPIRYTGRDDGMGTSSLIMNSTVFVHVVHVEWKSLTKIGFVSWVDENGQPQEMEVDEHYKPNEYNGETVDWRWINTVWEATRIGEDIYVNVQPKANQYRNLDNPSKCKLGYTGVIFNARNSAPYALVEIMKPHQYLYDIILYRLELEIARAQGKKMVFDVAQIPRTEGFDMDKWLYYFNILGIAFINSFEEGKGKFAGQRPTFNQFSQLDLSMARVIDQYIMLLDKIEVMAGEICGVTRQREGQITSSETVGGVERSVKQSSAITESLFFAHNLGKQHVLTSLLNAAQLAWAEGGKKTSYVTDDMTRVLLAIDGAEFCNAEYGIFVSNASQDDEILQGVKQLAQYAMNSNQASLKDIIKILKSKNIEKAEQILDDAYDKAQQAAQAQQQAEQQHEQQMQQMQLQVQQQQTQAQYQHEDQMNQRDNETKIQVAIIGAESSTGIPGELEADIMREELAADIALRTKELRDKKNVANRKLDLDSEHKKSERTDTKEIDNKQLSQDDKHQKAELNQEAKQSKAELALQKEIERKKLEQEKKESDAKIALEREKMQHEKEMAAKEQERADSESKHSMKQQDKEHKREQQTKVKVETIKAKNKPKDSK